MSLKKIISSHHLKFSLIVFVFVIVFSFSNSVFADVGQAVYTDFDSGGPQATFEAFLGTNGSGTATAFTFYTDNPTGWTTGSVYTGGFISLTACDNDATTESSGGGTNCNNRTRHNVSYGTGSISATGNFVTVDFGSADVTLDSSKYYIFVYFSGAGNPSGSGFGGSSLGFTSTANSHCRIACVSLQDYYWNLVGASGLYFPNHSPYSGTQYFATSNGTTDITPDAGFYSSCNGLNISIRNNPPDSLWGNIHTFSPQNSGAITISPYSHAHDPGGLHQFMMACDGSGTFLDPEAYILYNYSSGAISGVTVDVSSDITDSTTWHSNTIYVVHGDIEITYGDTLTIEPGTLIKFDEDSSLTVNGVLDSEGELNLDGSPKNILMTSINDDVISDTNNDGPSTGSPGEWKGIVIGSGGSATFDYTRIFYGGQSGGTEAEIYNDGGTLSITNSAISYGTTYGIYNDSGTATVATTDISFHDYGVYLNGGSATISSANKIHQNNLFGIFNDTVSEINAENNYWGDTSGPYNDPENLYGLGNAIYGDVDFDPWNSDSNYITNERIPEECGDYNDCTSVYDDVVLWKNLNVDLECSDALADAIDTWEGVDNVITFTEENSSPNLAFAEQSHDDVPWLAEWNPATSPDSIIINDYYVPNETCDQMQNSITHEIGHALGLSHSYTGNVMYYAVIPQTTLGPQDLLDYHYLWH